MMMRRLPLVVALAAFVLYVSTMGSGLTLNGLSLAPKLAGWDDSPIVGQPLLWLLSLPLRALPAGWIPLAVKLIAAGLAGTILGLLARTVQLLPWDRLWDGTSRFAYLLPILTACFICGLEFTFWQEATSTCGELLGLLLFAAVIWLLLEYNVRQQSRWLDTAAFVWGLGMAENWVMLLLLPLFVASVIWLERLRFFRWKFILRMAAFGLAGFSLYIVLPIANGLTHSPWTMGQAWIASLSQTRYIFLLLYYQFLRAHRLLLLVVGICYLVPTLPLLVRMKDEGTRNISNVDIFQLWIYRCLRLGLLLVCFWLAFDPVPGARQMVQHQLGIRMPMLTLDYLTAIGAAFLMGNLLLASQPAVRESYRRSRSGIAWRRAAVPIAAAGLAVIAIGLVARNAPAIVHVNFHPLEEFGELAVNSLPADHGVVLSDSSEKLIAFEAALAHHPGSRKWLAVDTRALPAVSYRARLEDRQPAGWLTDQNRHELSPIELRRLLEQVSRTNRVFYLHPSYGQFFERFYLEPVGAIDEIKLRGKDPLAVPPLSDHEVAANEQFWTSAWSEKLKVLVPPNDRSRVAAKFKKLGLAEPPNDQDKLVRNWFSVSLEEWAVTLQKQHRWSEAQVRFEQALQLNSNNISARISLACNANLRAGNKMGLAEVQKVAALLGGPEHMNAILNSSGPFDEPTFEFVLGAIFFDSRLLVQAAEQLERARTLAPGSPVAELALVETYNQLQMPERSRPLIDHLREELKKVPENKSLDLDLALLDSYSWLLETNVAGARDALQTVVKEHPEDPQIANRVMSAYLAFRDFTNALELVQERLAKTPDDVTSLNQKAVILMQSGRAADALSILDRVLTLTNEPAARVNRAFAYILNQNFPAAKEDLNELNRSNAAPGAVDFGFALLAEHDRDTNAAERYLQLCISNTPMGAPLWQQAKARLSMLASKTTAK